MSRKLIFHYVHRWFIPLMVLAALLLILIPTSVVNAQPPPRNPWAWGDNSIGELCNSTNIGTENPNTMPVQANGLSGVVTSSGIGDTPLQFTSAGHVIGFTESGVIVASADHMLRVEFLNSKGVAPEADGEVSEENGTALTSPLSRVTYRNLWDDVTVVYEASEGSILKSTYYVNATEEGVLAHHIQLHYNRPIRIDENGNLVITYENGTIVEGAPVAWQDTEGGRKPVTVTYVLHGEREVGFSVGAYLPGIPVVIDPVMTWNTFLGGPGVDYENAITVDSSGNVYVCGYSEATWGSPVRAYTSSMRDAFVVKLDTSTGVLLWNTFLGGVGDDAGWAIAVDGSGNIYVSGYSSATWGSPVRAYTSEIDTFVAKLNNDGAIIWNSFLGGTGSNYGTAIAVDTSGNVYVGGYSYAAWGSPVRAYTLGNDAFAAKLNNDGVLQWNTFLGGSGNEAFHAIAVDSSGNIYVSGQGEATWGSPIRAYTSGRDAFVVKLNSSTGTLTWNTFLGTSGWDEGRAIAVDSSGSIYIGGYSEATWGSPIRAYTSSGGRDAFVAKINNSGSLQWNTFLGGSGGDEGYAIVVDGSSNIYIGGYSYATWGSPVRSYTSGRDAFAAKLNNDGALQWNTFLGDSGDDFGRAIAVDSAGNVFVSGDSTATWGSPVWPYTSGSDVFVAKLDSSGGGPTPPVITWNTFLGGPGEDYGQAIAVDGSGNLYIAGMSEATWGSPVRAYTSGMDAFAAKLNSSGSLLWNTFLGGSANDGGYAITVDASGYIYIDGYSEATWGSPVRAYTSGRNAFAAKLNSSGSLQWSTFLGGSGYDFGQAIAVDGSGNLYIAGISVANWGLPVRAYTGSADTLVAKLDSSGNLIWNTFLGGFSNDWGSGIAVSGGGNVYIAGGSSATWGSPVRAYTGDSGHRDAFVAKLNSNGILLWNTFLGGNYNDYASSIAVDASENVFVAADSAATWGSPVHAFVGATGLGDILVAKLNSSGNLLWNTFLGGSGHDRGFAIAIANSGNIYVAGFSETTWGSPVRPYTFSNDAFAAKLNSSGNLQWNTFLGGPGVDYGWAIAGDGSGNIYVAGSSETTWGSPVRPYTSGSDAFAAKLDSSGGGPIPPAGTFAAMVEYPAGAGSYSVAAADLNGDGHPDLAVANAESNTVSVLFNNGNGTFAPKMDYPTGTGPVWVVAVDVNGDSNPDLAVANQNSNTVSVLLNNGNGTFAPKMDYPTGSGSDSVAAADFNSDGHPDLSVTNPNSNTVSVLFNNGNGTFAPKMDYPTGTFPDSVAAMDLNGDGHVDLAMANWLSDTVSVLINNGNGTFAPKVDYPTSGPYTDSVIVVDLNGDSYPDLAVGNSNSNTVSVLFNNGNGTFAPKMDYPTGSSPRSVAAADLNGDGYPDLAVANVNGNTVSLLLNNGNGTFAPKMDYPTGTAPTSVAAADLNGDGYPDLAVANYAGTVSVLINNMVNQPPNQPSNASPANATTGISLTPTLQSSAFSDPDVGDTHAISQWQIATTSGNYSNPVFDSGTDTTNLTSITIPSGNLNYNTTYYWHVRHQDNHGAWSTWSAETSFITLAQYAFTITVTAGAHGSITPGTGTVNDGDTPTYTITADAGYHVADVLVDALSVGPVTSYIFDPVHADHTISASFLSDGNTPIGSPVVVDLGVAVVIFDNVTTAEDTTVTTSQGNPTGGIPSGFRVRGYFIDISTTAIYTGNVTVGIRYEPSAVANPQNLKLFHWEGNNWVDITDHVDTANNIIYGVVTSLSPFFVGDPAGVPMSVGGIAVEFPVGGSDSSSTPYAVIIGGVMAALAAIALGGWFAKRRWIRRYS